MKSVKDIFIVQFIILFFTSSFSLFPDSNWPTIQSMRSEKSEGAWTNCLQKGLISWTTIIIFNWWQACCKLCMSLVLFVNVLKFLILIKFPISKQCIQVKKYQAWHHKDQHSKSISYKDKESYHYIYYKNHFSFLSFNL